MQLSSTVACLRKLIVHVVQRQPQLKKAYEKRFRLQSSDVRSVLRKIRYVLRNLGLREIVYAYKIKCFHSNYVKALVADELERRSIGLEGAMYKIYKECDAARGMIAMLDENVSIGMDDNQRKNMNGKNDTILHAELSCSNPQTGEAIGTLDSSTTKEEKENDSSPSFDVISDKQRYYSRFKTQGRELMIKFRKPSINVSLNDALKKTFKDLHDLLVVDHNECDYIGVSCLSDSFAQGDAWMSFRPIRDFDSEQLSNLILNVAQSNAEYDVEEPLKINCSVVKGVQGTGRKALKLTFDNVNKRSVLSITNSDNLCLPRSLVAAQAYAIRGFSRSGEADEFWHRIRRPKNYQKEKALELVHAASLTIPDNGCGINEVSLFQKFLARTGFAIIVYSCKSFGKAGIPPLFDGRDETVQVFGKIVHTLYILYYDNGRHFEPVLNITGALSVRNYCGLCNVGYREAGKHSCVKKCPRCYTLPPCKTAHQLRCNDCRRYFFGKRCFDHHRQRNSCAPEKSVCDGVKLCPRCMKRLAGSHKCGVSKCNTCRSMIEDMNHLCYMQPLKKKSEKDKFLFIFYDFESRQDTLLEGSNKDYEHVPTLCVVQQVCTLCIDNDEMLRKCLSCNFREHVFSIDPVKEFCDYVLKVNTSFTKIVCIAHNSQSYDAVFLLHHIIKNCREEPRLILNGTKIVQMTYTEKIVFIDSLNYFHMALSKLPKAFGFPEEKGYFPHLFNTVSNQNYIGPLPDKKFYSPDQMNTDARKKFLDWYDGLFSQNYVFDFQKEIVHYCKQDMRILKLACLAFRRIFLDLGNVCPFTEACTIASTCNKVFRKNHLTTNTIGLIPRGGYRLADRQSAIALKWLTWREKVEGVVINHAARGREIRLSIGVLVDGYFVSTNTVYQFHGCFWHGCPKCFVSERDALSVDVKHVSTSLADRYDRTCAISKRIKSAGYNLVEEWECSFRDFLENDEEVTEFLSTQKWHLTHALNPRDSFYGGRVANMVTFYEASGSEKITYVDICSLYPWVCKYGKYPIGHPTVYVGDECFNLVGTDNSLEHVEGLVSCRFLAPRKLLHPVLPVRMNERLLFPLCRTCAENHNHDPCRHLKEEDRWFEGTYVSDELKKAVELGYKILNVFEIWQYETTRYDKSNGFGGLFTKYIDSFLKIKQEASGFPEGCVTDEDKAAYITDYLEAENIQLDKEKICKNPGLRAVAKLGLNSFWGKLGQRDNLRRTRILKSWEELIRVLTDASLEVSGFFPINEEAVSVTMTFVDEAVEQQPNTNVVLACYTTAQARLKLYSYLEQLQDRILYFDTDCCIYVSRPGACDIKTGTHLGDMVSELAADEYITKFCSIGPKAYAYVSVNSSRKTNVVCKIKGVRLNYTNSHKINLEVLEKFVKNVQTDPIVLVSDAIRRTPFHDVVTRRESKTVKPVLKKSRPYGEFYSRPFGYSSECDDECD